MEEEKASDNKAKGVTRRRFPTTMGASAAVVAASAGNSPPRLRKRLRQ